MLGIFGKGVFLIVLVIVVEVFIKLYLKILLKIGFIELVMVCRSLLVFVLYLKIK